MNIYVYIDACVGVCMYVRACIYTLLPPILCGICQHYRPQNLNSQNCINYGDFNHIFSLVYTLIHIIIHPTIKIIIIMINKKKHKKKTPTNIIVIYKKINTNDHFIVPGLNEMKIGLG